MKKPSHFAVMRGFAGFFLLATACVMAGYGILSLFELSGLWQTVLSLWVGSAILALIGMLLHVLGKGSREKRDRQQHNELLDAMARIAQGDFSVFVRTDNLVHTELADAINKEG